MYSDQMQGEMSLIVIEGRGEFVGKEARRHPVKRGDVIVSEMSEPHTFQATTTLRLLVTITPTGSSGEVATLPRYSGGQSARKLRQLLPIPTLQVNGRRIFVPH
jgi:hypothetical protein